MFEDVRLGPAFRQLVCGQPSPVREALLAEERRFAREIIQSFAEDGIVVPMPENLFARALCLQVDLLRDGNRKSIEMSVYDAQEELLLRGDFPLNDEMRGINFFVRYWEGAFPGLMADGCSKSPGLMSHFDRGRKDSHKDGSGLFSAIGEDMGLTIPHSLSCQLFEFTANLWPHRSNPFPRTMLAIVARPDIAERHYA